MWHHQKMGENLAKGLAMWFWMILLMIFCNVNTCAWEWARVNQDQILKYYMQDILPLQITSCPKMHTQWIPHSHKLTNVEQYVKCTTSKIQSYFHMLTYAAGIFSCVLPVIFLILVIQLYVDCKDFLKLVVTGVSLSKTRAEINWKPLYSGKWIYFGF